jgi:hypothetical protein
MASKTAGDVVAQKCYKIVKKAPLDRYNLVRKFRSRNISKHMSVLNKNVATYFALISKNGL